MLVELGRAWERCRRAARVVQLASERNSEPAARGGPHLQQARLVVGGCGILPALQPLGGAPLAVPRLRGAAGGQQGAQAGLRQGGCL